MVDLRQKTGGGGGGYGIRKRDVQKRERVAESLLFCFLLTLSFSRHKLNSVYHFNKMSTC